MQKLNDKRLFWRGSTIWCRVPDPKGAKTATGRPLTVRLTTYTGDPTAASLKADEYERCAASPDYAPSRSVTLETGINELLYDMKRRELSHASQTIAVQTLGHFMRLWGGDTQICRITGKMVHDFIDKRQGEFATRARTRHVSNVTIKMELQKLGQMMKLARWNHRIKGLSLEEVIPPNFSGGGKPRKTFGTQEQIDKLLLELTKEKGAYVLYMVATGVRLGELYRATAADTSWTRRVVHVNGTKTVMAEDDVPITRTSETLLRQALANAPNQSGKGPLFPKWGKMHRDLRAACARAAIPYMTPNDFRRTFAHWQLQAGVPRELVYKMLRHEDPSMLDQVYGDERGEDMHARLDSVKLVKKTNLKMGSKPAYHATKRPVPDLYRDN